MVWKLILHVIVLLIFCQKIFPQEQKIKSKPVFAIEQLKKIKSEGILISPTEMTQIMFEELENSRDFEIIYLQTNYDKKVIENADVLIQGEYLIESNLITVDFELIMLKTKSRLKHKVNRMELSEIKAEVLKNISGIFVELTIKSSPNFCDVEIDGINLGRTPLTIEKLLSGTHLIHLTHEGYFGLYQEVDINKSITLNYTLEPQRANNATNPAPIGGIESITKNIKYPEKYQKEGLEGDIIVLVVVNEKGDVKDTVVKKSQGDMAVDLAVIEAIKSAKWKSAKLDNKSVEGSTQLVIRFTKGN